MHWPAEAGTSPYPYLDEKLISTGQIVFNKAGNNGLNLAVLHLANHMMDNEDMYGFLSYGDKDTFVSPLPPVSSLDEARGHSRIGR
jgi:hypothetical protein